MNNQIAFPFARTILSLFDYSGVWSQPYRETGYHVIQVDLKFGQDIRLFEKPDYPVHGILAAPECTHLAGSGARWWESKGDEALLEALSLIDATMRIIMVTQPEWWCLENPIGRLNRWLGEPVMYFDPCDYGDPYTKRTALWGNFNTELLLNRVEPIEGSKMHLLSPSPERAMLRSKTPLGFARAFFEANP